MAAQKTLRLLMPEWQGGDYDLSVGSGELYPLGARLLAFLAPQSGEETIEVPVPAYKPGFKREKENGVYNQEATIAIMKAAAAILAEKRPDRVITFGGECLVSQAPFDYLNGRYNGDLAILWIDAHPDISTPANHDREHAMVLGNLLGGGDPVMAKEVARRFSPDQVLLLGQSAFDSPAEVEIIKKLGLRVLPPEAIANGNAPVIDWLKAGGFKNLAVHLDLDSLDPAFFYSQLSNDPFAEEKYPTVKGKLRLDRIASLLAEAGEAVNIAGLTIAEYIPWDAYSLKKFMAGLPIMR